jgi:SET domain-containing protein
MIKTRTKSSAIPIEVRTSVIHGSGAFATRTLKPEDLIGRYTGKVYPAEAVSARDWDHVVTFVFGLSDGSVIDGAQGGNATRHINHSCSPNCVAFEVESNGGEPWIVIEALRRIEAGEELFLDYSLDADVDSPEDFACGCGSATCRGTLLGAQTPPV